MQSETDEMNPSSAQYSPSTVTKGTLREKEEGVKVSAAWDCGINRRDLTLKLSSAVMPDL